jgi:2-polyprenyl-3-methyl-5-hydroxy-6-metoxy-1,4-benzoquinol methylase
MPDFNQRSTLPEIMDDFSLQHQEIDPVLKELEVINKLLGGFSVFYDAFKRINLAKGDLICDWGCGGGDSLTVLRKHFKKNNLDFNYLGLDATKTTVEFATQNHINYPEITFKEVDVLKHQFIENQYDVVISSLFTHHFEDNDWVELIKRMVFSAKKAVIINDLHRHPLAYYSIALLTQLFSKSPMVKHDSKVSVLRSFKKHELKKLLDLVGVKNYTIKWMWAFRWQVIIYKV